MRFEHSKCVGYAGLALAAILGTAACSMTSHRTAEQKQLDSETAARVSSALNSDSEIYARHIDVRANNGIVHLGGYVWSDSDLYRAKEIAQEVSGVAGVVDDLELERGGSNNSDTSR